MILKKTLYKGYMKGIKEWSNVVFGHVTLFGGQVYLVTSIISYISVISAVRIFRLLENQ